MRSRFSIILLLFLSTICFAQTVTVRGKFLTDSIKIGQQVPFVLAASYSKKADVLFPDSTYSFAPFEFQKKKFFPTVTKDSLSYDSAVYFLSTYEIDSLQNLRLPVFLVQGKDSTAVYTSADTLLLVQMVASMPDTVKAENLPLKTNTAYQKVKWMLNYPIILIIVAVIVVALIVVWIVFGKRIRKHFALKRLYKNHQAFVDQYTRIAEQIKSEASSPKAEQAMVLWKKYMEALLAKPFTKFTSKEIIAQEEDETLGYALHAVDRLIYGGVMDQPEQSLATLRQYTDAQFQRKTEEVKNG